MRNAIKSICLNGRIMQHIFKNHFFAYFQFMVEFPISHKITTQTTVSSQTVNVISFRLLHHIFHFDGFGIAYSRMIWHLQTIRHVASKADIQNGGFVTMVFHHIHNLRNERSRLPSEGTTRFHDDMKMRIAQMKLLYYINKV